MATSWAQLCVSCWQERHFPVLLHGPLSLPYRMFGVRPSRMNPNTCTLCEMMFTRWMNARTISLDVTVLFADLRNYTSLSQTLPPAAMSALLDAFYDECSAAVWGHDGLLNKTAGDAIMAIFNFPIRRDDHAARAVLAARELQRRCEARRAGFPAEGALLEGHELGVGIGIASGEVNFGEFGHAHRDLTAVGTVVNTAARAQAAAAAGGILVTDAVRTRAGELAADARSDDYQLKGFGAPVRLHAL